LRREPTPGADLPVGGRSRASIERRAQPKSLRKAFARANPLEASTVKNPSRTLHLLALAGLALGCASEPTAPGPDRSTAWGYLTLVPHEGASAGSSSGGAYGDRRMGAVQLVDYSRPGFAVVYLDPAPGGNGARAQANETELRIHEGAVATRIDPSHAAIASGGRVVVRNDSAAPHVLSCPAAGMVLHVPAGGSVDVPAPNAGEYAFFLLDVPGASSSVFAAPGAHTVVSDSGRFELADLEPGRRTIHVWHPRLPPISMQVDLQPGAVRRVDLEMGVGRGTPEGTDAP